jgi:hypothetical protein
VVVLSLCWACPRCVRASAWSLAHATCKVSWNLLRHWPFACAAADSFYMTVFALLQPIPTAAAAAAAAGFVKDRPTLLDVSMAGPLWGVTASGASIGCCCQGWV